MIPKQIPRQRDFSAGQLDDSAMRRDDTPLLRSGGRQMTNKRILSTGALDQRPGRSALFAETGRTDEVRMDTDVIFRFSFGDASLKIRNDSGTLLYSITGMPWGAFVQLITWAAYEKQVFIAYPGSKLQVFTWAGGETWSNDAFAVAETNEGRRAGPFARLSPTGITMSVNARTGTGQATFSSAILTAAHLGTRVRYGADKQVTIDSLVTAFVANVTINEALNGGETLAFGSAVDSRFAIGQLVAGNTTQAQGEICAFPTSDSMTVRLTTTNGFQNGETVIGPNARNTITGVPTAVDPPATTVWDDEVFNDLRGWPGSVFVDQNRLGLCDIPAIKGGIAWSALRAPFDFYPDADPDDAIFEIVPKKARVYYVTGGDDEFVFTDIGVYYIPISETNPLIPGSVAFREITSDAAGQVVPAKVAQGTLFVNEGGTRVIAIVPTGQTARPYITRDVSAYHSDLINNPKVLAASSGAGQFAESYVFILNVDGSMAVGRYEPAKEWVGFVPWTGAADGFGTLGEFEWVSALGGTVLFTTAYSVAGTTTRRIVEQLDSDAYLDAQIRYNDPPVALDGGGSLGPLWYLAGGRVSLIDGTKPMGTRAVDANGDIVPIEGEDLSSATLTAGVAWTEVFEPFIPHAEGGRSVKQSMRKRKVSLAVMAKHSTGFTVGNRRVPPWRQGDNASNAPPLREETQRFKISGRSFDPRIQVVKDVPGPCRIIEVSPDVTV